MKSRLVENVFVLDVVHKGGAADEPGCIKGVTVEMAKEALSEFLIASRSPADLAPQS